MHGYSPIHTPGPSCSGRLKEQNGATSAQARDILKRADRLRLFADGSPKQSREALGVLAEARAWLDYVRKRIDEVVPCDALELADSYELMHRIATGTAAKDGISSSLRMLAFEACIHGDASVDQYMLYRAVMKEISEGNALFTRKPLEWCFIALDRWYFNMISFPSANYDNICQARILFHADLRAYVGCGEQAFKRKLYETYGDLFVNGQHTSAIFS